MLNEIDTLDSYEVEAFPMIKNIQVVCEDKYLPSYANDTDACMDLKLKIETGKDILDVAESKVYSTGLKIKVPKNHIMLIFPRSSTGFKLSCMLANTTAIIDEGYRDEIKLKIFNYGNHEVVLEDGQRIAQFVILPRPTLNLIQVVEDINFKEGDRGGGIGSTGK